MSRTQRTANNSGNNFPNNPVISRGYINKATGEVMFPKTINGKFVMIDDEEGGTRPEYVAIPSVQEEGAPELPVLIPLEMTYYRYFFNKISGLEARTTEYQNRKDKVAMWMQNLKKGYKWNKKPDFRGNINELPTMEGKEMSTGARLYIYSPSHDLTFFLELTAIGRRAWTDFRDAFADKNDGDEYPSFVYGGTRSPNAHELDTYNWLEGWSVPIFAAVDSATTSDFARADLYSRELDNYFAEHPDFVATAPEEDKDTSAPVQNIEADKAAEKREKKEAAAEAKAAAEDKLKGDISGFPTKENDEPTVEASTELPF